MNEAMIDALNDCLIQIQAGKSLEEVLNLYPNWAEDLRSLLMAALATQAMCLELDVPAEAQAKSRARVLAKAQAANQSRPSPFSTVFLRYGPVLAGIAALAIILILGTGIASAAAVPGDIFYPVKLVRERTQLLFVTDPVKRLELEQSFDQERADEAEVLIEHGRASELTLSGTLIQNPDGRWYIAKVEIIFTGRLITDAEAIRNSYVDVHGVLQNSGTLLAEQVSLHQIEFNGVLQEINGDQWTVSRIPVMVNHSTDISGDAVQGSDVRVTATRGEDGNLVASEIAGSGSPQKDDHRLTAATDTPGELEDATKEIDPSKTATSTNSSTQETGRQIEPTETNHTGDTEERRPSPTPTLRATPRVQPAQTQTPTGGSQEDDHSPAQTKTATPEHKTDQTQTPQSDKGD